jgi:hypothetical protein
LADLPKEAFLTAFLAAARSLGVAFAKRRAMMLLFLGNIVV